MQVLDRPHIFPCESIWGLVLRVITQCGSLEGTRWWSISMLDLHRPTQIICLPSATTRWWASWIKWLIWKNWPAYRDKFPWSKLVDSMASELELPGLNWKESRELWTWRHHQWLCDTTSSKTRKLLGTLLLGTLWFYHTGKTGVISGFLQKQCHTNMFFVCMYVILLLASGVWVSI